VAVVDRAIIVIWRCVSIRAKLLKERARLRASGWLTMGEVSSAAVTVQASSLAVGLASMGGTVLPVTVGGASPDQSLCGDIASTGLLARLSLGIVDGKIGVGTETVDLIGLA
tara:strand:+ start:844 stop:1179 length:336 start_codon:yes stop_codon:yes gene_type:complete